MYMLFFFFKQKTAYDMRISDWSSDVCSSDLDPVEQEFWKRCQDGNLYFQRCSGCGCFRHLPRYMCAKCGAPEFSWERSSGKGTLFSWTVTHQALHPAFAAEIPFVAAVVELEEGVRMATRLIGCDHERLALDLPDRKSVV